MDLYLSHHTTSLRIEHDTCYSSLQIVGKFFLVISLAVVFEIAEAL